MKENSKKTPFIVAMVSAAASIGFHTYLTLQHYKLKLGMADSGSICNLSSKFNCDAVNTSSYSAFLGYPVALWGATFNAMLFLVLLWHVLVPNRKSRNFSLYLSFFIAAVSIIMGGISLTQLGTFCLFCIATYILSFISFFSIYWGSRDYQPSEFGADLKSYFTKGDGLSYLVFAVLAGPVAVLLINDMAMRSAGDQLKYLVQDSIGSWKASPVYNFDEASGLKLGSDPGQTKMTIVEFADFRCPHCRRASPSLHAFTQSRKDVRLVFLNFPLDSNCNPAIQHPGDSCNFAKAVLCADKEGKGWQASEYIFDRQGKIKGSDLSGLITELGLNESQFQQCLQANETHETVVSQAKQGIEAKVQGTPAVYVNGKPLPAGHILPVLEAVYREL